MIHVFDLDERVFHTGWNIWGTVIRINDPATNLELEQDELTFGVKFDNFFAEYEVWPGELRPLSPSELLLHRQRNEEFAWR